MTNELTEISYSLSKRVPDLEHLVVIHSGHGDIVLRDDDARHVARAVRDVLRRRLNRGAWS